eukprot:gene18223-biopygen11448
MDGGTSLERPTSSFPEEVPERTQTAIERQLAGACTNRAPVDRGDPRGGGALRRQRRRGISQSPESPGARGEMPIWGEGIKRPGERQTQQWYCVRAQRGRFYKDLGHRY